MDPSEFLRIGNKFVYLQRYKDCFFTKKIKNIVFLKFILLKHLGKIMFLKKRSKYWFKVCKNAKTVGGDENSNFLGSSPFKPLKIIILPKNFNLLYRVHSKVNVKKNQAEMLIQTSEKYTNSRRWGKFEPCVSSPFRPLKIHISRKCL